MQRRSFISGMAGASLLGSGGLLGQDDPGMTLRTGTLRILVPTTVVEKSTNTFVTNLRPDDFKILDAGIEQTGIAEDFMQNPLSVVMVVQKSADMQAFLPEVQKIAPAVETLLLGEAGEAAVIAFDHRIRTLTDFTNDGKQFREALKQLTPGSNTAAQVDAMAEAMRMLRRRAENRKKVIILIAEEKDRGSELRTKSALQQLQFSDITVYAFNVSQLVRTLTAKPGYPPRSNVPPNMRVDPMGRPMDPVVAQQMYGYGGLGNVAPLIKNIFEGVKDVFVASETELWTKFTGGLMYNFKNSRDLERIILRLHEDMASQYLLSYMPNNATKQIGGWHTIQVVVKRPGVEVRTRPGYWAATRLDQSEAPQR